MSMTKEEILAELAAGKLTGDELDKFLSAT